MKTSTKIKKMSRSPCWGVSDPASRKIISSTFDMGVEMIYSFGLLAPLIETFIEVVIIIGPLTIAGVILLLKKIEKDNPDRIRWK